MLSLSTSKLTGEGLTVRPAGWTEDTIYDLASRFEGYQDTPQRRSDGNYDLQLVASQQAIELPQAITAIQGSLHQ